MTYEKNLPAQQNHAKKNVRFPKKNVDRRRTQSDPTKTTSRTLSSQRVIFPFPKSSRLLKSSQYQQLKHNSRCFIGTSLMIHFQLSSSPHRKLGITVTKKFGPAVCRNRFKRQIRETFRLHCLQLPSGIQMNVLPKKGVSTFSCAQMRADLLELVTKIQR